MAICPACDFELDVDDYEIDEGEELSCPECGSLLRVAGLDPLELEEVSDDDEDEDDDELEDDEIDDEDDEDEDETEDEDEGWNE